MYTADRTKVARSDRSMAKNSDRRGRSLEMISQMGGLMDRSGMENQIIPARTSGLGMIVVGQHYYMLLPVSVIATRSSKLSGLHNHNRM
jgi:hypothetical protein